MSGDSTPTMDKLTPDHPEDILRVGTVLRHASAPWQARNGLPESTGYRWRNRDAEREAEVAAFVAEAKRRAQESTT